MNMHVSPATGVKIDSARYVRPTSGKPVSADPIFERIERHRSIVAKITRNDAREIRLSDAQMFRAIKAFDAQAWEMIDNPPVTHEGAVALLRYSVEVEDAFGPDGMGWPDGAAKSGRPGKVWTDELRRIVPGILAAPPNVIVGDRLLNNTEGSCSTEEAAVLDFEPWQSKPGEWMLPKNDELARLTGEHFAGLQMAWKLLHMTKPRMMKVIEDMDNNTGQSLFDHLEGASNFFEALHTIASSAEARLLCAGSAVVEKTERAGNGKRSTRPRDRS